MDRSTEEHSRLVRKFHGYWWYLQSPTYEQGHANHRRVNVLFVTTGQQRLLNMMEALRLMPKPNRAAHGGKGLFWFSLEIDYELRQPLSLLRPIWRTVNGATTGHKLMLLESSSRPAESSRHKAERVSG